MAEIEEIERELFRGIVKLQRPLNDPAAPWLAYPCGRERRWFLDPSAELAAKLGADAKGYFLAEEMEGGDIEILDRVPVQPW